MSEGGEEFKFGRIKYNAGQKVGNAIYIKEMPCDKDRKALFKCECGNYFTAWIHSVKSGITKSCGCYRKEYMRSKQTTHGLSKHPLYNVYNNMMERCYTETNNSYSTYGGRSVSVCDEWRNDFVSFYNWCIENGWRIDLQLDKDIKGSGLIYSPDSCVFATPSQNCNKRRSSRIIEFDNKSNTLAEWSKIIGVASSTIHARLNVGWSIKDALTTKVKSRKQYDRK